MSHDLIILNMNVKVYAAEGNAELPRSGPSEVELYGDGHIDCLANDGFKIWSTRIECHHTVTSDCLRIRRFLPDHRRSMVLGNITTLADQKNVLVFHNS